MPNPDITNIDKRGLAAGDNEYRQETLADGNTVVKGQLLGFVSASGLLAITASASVDGSENGRVLAAEDKTASGSDEPITVLIKGKVDASLIVFDGADDLDTVVAGQPDTYEVMLRDYGIYANDYPGDQILDNQP